jgi:glycosyltransferase involved in cell wall biosynthesis
MNVSVIIPVYNAEKYLEKAIESVLQLIEVKELILVEDGSPDNAFQICEKWLASDKRVKMYIHPNNENRGAGASRNLGIKMASQEFIAFLDADDYYLPNRFEKDREVFKNNEDADGVYNAIGVHFYSEIAKKQFSQSFSLPLEGIENHLTTVTPNVSADDLFDILIGVNKEKGNGYFHLNGLTIKRKVLNKLSNYFHPELRLHQDTELMLRLAYYHRLYASNTVLAVAIRGVHEANRITNSSDIKIGYKIKYFNILSNWVKKEDMNVNVQDKIRFTLIKLKYDKLNSFQKLILYIISVFREDRFYKSSYGNDFHYNLFKNIKIQKLYSKVFFKLFRSNKK